MHDSVEKITKNFFCSDKVPITSNNSHERKHSSRSSRSVTSQSKSGNSPARQPESSEQVDSNVQSTTQTQRRHNRKKVDDNTFHSQLLQIKPQIVDVS